MDESKYAAHMAEDGRIQTLAEHHRGTAEQAAKFAAPFEAAPAAFYAGRTHDIGKCSDDGQRRILEDGPVCDHATAGAIECARRGAGWAACAVMGHHGGLPDVGNAGDEPGALTYFGRLKKGFAGGIPDYASRWHGELPPPPDLPGWGQDPVTDSFLVRMLYSCLVDADFLDTERFMDPSRERGGYDGMRELDRRLAAYEMKKGWDRPEGDLNRRRSEILRTCRDAGKRPRGLYTLTAPTGGGKTAASLAFALRHAVENGMDRVVYIVPYTSVIEQNAQVFRKMLGDNNVLEHHAGSPADMDEDAAPEQRRGALTAENWDAPVVVTTAVRFFEAMYANRPSKCRRLHNLANSVLIFDEAQMLPVEHLRPCVAAIAQLVKNFRATAVLCTATQPALDRQFRPYGLTPSELFAALPEEGSFHLSTLMCPAHRRAVLARIRKRLDAGMPCRVVSTSLVEAGVDVDFPAVYRQMAGLDSILQAAGRCNREGKNPAALLEAVTLRIRAERDINRQKAAILKAYYLKNQNDDCPKEVLQVRLNEASTNIPYTFGRLFAVYEAIQKAANPGINTTIRDKYFNAAASTPAMIFPILDNLCLKHLRKLPAGRRISLDRQVGALKDILGEEYPLRLNLPEQGSFNQGYFHQRQKLFEKREGK